MLILMDSNSNRLQTRSGSSLKLHTMIYMSAQFLSIVIFYTMIVSDAVTRMILIGSNISWEIFVRSYICYFTGLQEGLTRSLKIRFLQLNGRALKDFYQKSTVQFFSFDKSYVFSPGQKYLEYFPPAIFTGLGLTGSLTQGVILQHRQVFCKCSDS